MLTIPLLSLLFALATAPLPGGGRSLLPEGGINAASLRGSDAYKGSAARTVDVEGQGFDAAARVEVEQLPEKSHHVQLNWPLTAVIEEGDVVMLRVHARTVASDDESGAGTLGLVVERNSDPHKKLLDSQHDIGREWTVLDQPFTARFDLPRGEGQFNIRLGYAEQALEIGGVELINYGKSFDLAKLPRTRLTYRGIEPDAAWRKEARERIERHRMADLTVKVVDADGKPVPGAKVSVEQTRHAFGFGAAITAKSLMEESPDREPYRKIVEERFNKVVFENDLKWGGFEAGKNNSEGTYRHVWLDPAMDWVRERDIEIRGHYLMWAPVGRWQPERFRGEDIDAQELKRATFDHIREKLAFTDGRCGEWDAVNHIIGWGKTYADWLGGPEVYAETIKLGRELAPHAEMWINEGQILPSEHRVEPYLEVIADLERLDARPDGVGFMGHFTGGSLNPPARVYEVIDRFATAHPDIKLQLTEFDVDVAGDEQLQADYLRDIMIVAFSHPQMEGIVMWGFWEGRHWKPDAALWRRDWSIKPAGEAWLDLVFEEWWTRAEGETDAEGSYNVRGFLGEYRMTATGPDGEGEQAVGQVTLMGEGDEGGQVTLKLNRR